MATPLKVVIIEDCESDAELLVRELEKGGFSVTETIVDEPESFQQALLTQQWDIIFSDHSMPHFSSTEAFNLLKDSGLDIPFIVISGTLGEDAAVEAMRAGVSDYMMKGKLARLIPAVDRELREADSRKARKNAENELEASHLLLKEYTRELESYTQKLKQSNKELEQFALIASHDLQEPLRKVKVFSDLLQVQLSDKLEPETTDTIERIQRSITKMQTLIDDLLDLSRVIRKGKPFQKFSLAPLLREVQAELGHQIKELGAQIEIGDMVILAGDPSQIQQLLFHLLDNALKFHRDQVPPIVKISSHCIEGQFCEVQVKDNGTGFNPEYSERIFEVFERLHGDKYPGTGIGLALCQKIVERHGGVITVKSQIGEGSLFKIRLPYRNE